MTFLKLENFVTKSLIESLFEELKTKLALVETRFSAMALPIPLLAPVNHIVRLLKSTVFIVVFKINK
jgi:hypothetical protein